MVAFYWLTSDQIRIVMTKMDMSNTERLNKSLQHSLTHGAGSCNDCDDGLNEPSIQASYTTIINMCAELDRRGSVYTPSDEIILQRALNSLTGSLDTSTHMNVVMEVEGIPLEPLEPLVPMTMEEVRNYEKRVSAYCKKNGFRRPHYTLGGQRYDSDDEPYNIV